MIGSRGGREIDVIGDLSPYKVEPLSACWWCGSTGPLTSEHKFKHADLKRMGEGRLTWGTDGFSREVRSIRKSSEVRFQPSLCGPCNNHRSQPFDRAYQKFSEHVWSKPPRWRKRFLDMSDIYGDDWRVETVDLARYLVKHIGCRLASERYPIPPSLAKFLGGAEALSDVQMVLFKSRPHYKLYKQGKRDGIDTRGLWITPALGSVSKSRHCLSMYSSGFIVGHVGVFYRWELDGESADPFYRYRNARLWPRHRLPEM